MGTCSNTVSDCCGCPKPKLGGCCDGKRSSLPSILQVEFLSGADAGRIIPVTFDNSTGLWIGTFVTRCDNTTTLIIQVACGGPSGCLGAVLCCALPPSGCCNLFFCARTDEFTCECTPLMFTAGLQVTCKILRPVSGTPPCSDFIYNICSWGLQISE